MPAGQDLDLALEAPVDGERDLARPLPHRPCARVDPAPHDRADQVRRAHAPAHVGDRDGLRAGARHLVPRREAVVEQPVEDAVAAALEARRALPGVVEGGPARDAGEGGGLGEGEVPRGLVEVEAARGVDAADAGAERDPVQVLLEDGALVERALDAQGERRLHELAAQGARAPDEAPRELLGDGRGARDDAPVQDELAEGPGDRHGVDAEVVGEAVVLRGQDRALHTLADLVERHPAGPHPVAGAQLAQDDAVPVAQHGAGARRSRLGELGRERGEGRGDEEREDRAEDDDGEEDTPGARMEAGVRAHGRAVGGGGAGIARSLTHLRGGTFRARARTREDRSTLGSTGSTLGSTGSTLPSGGYPAVIGALPEDRAPAAEEVLLRTWPRSSARRHRGRPRGRSVRSSRRPRGALARR